MPLLFESNNICYCQRCESKCKVDPIPGSKAKMLKRGESAKGLCINCATHDVLRNLYPANLLLARSGPKGLALRHVQQQFEAILKCAGTDSHPGEIDWQAIIDNWDLPFPTKVKRSPMNPAGQAELDREPEENRKRIKLMNERMKDPRTDEEISEANYKKAGELLIDAMRKRNGNP